MGAWIETLLDAQLNDTLLSHPTWVRGLKQSGNAWEATWAKSHPTWVRGLKLSYSYDFVFVLCRILHGCVD